MSLRYHLIYYAVACLLGVLVMLIHPVFFSALNYLCVLYNSSFWVGATCNDRAGYDFLFSVY